MFTSLTIAGLGPHAKPTTITLSPTGRTIVRSPSQGGKSTALYALCVCLLACAPDGGAFDVDIMSADRLALEVRTPNRIFSFKRTRSGSPKWTHEEMVEHPFPRTATAAKEWVRMLGEDIKLPLWKGSPSRREAVRFAFVPMAWTELATSDGAASRKLRDALVSTAGATPEEAAKLLFAAAGYELDEEVYSPKVAEKAVTDANRALDVAAGRASQAAAALTGIVEPVAADTSAADDLPNLEAAERGWANYDRARVDYDRKVCERASAREVYDRKAAEVATVLASLDQWDASAIAAAETAHRAALALWDEEATSRVKRHAAEVEQAAVEYRAAVEARAERMALALADAQRRHGEDVDAAEQDYQRDVTGRAERVAKIEADHARAVETHAATVARIEWEHSAAVIEWAGRCADLRTAYERALAAHADEVIALDEWKAEFDALPEDGPPCVTCGHVATRGERLDPIPLVGPEPVLSLPPRPVAEVAGPPPVVPTLPPEPTRRTVPAFVAPAPEREVVTRTVAPLGPMRPLPVYVAPTPSYRPAPLVWTEPDPLVEPSAPTVDRPSADALRAAHAATTERARHAIRLEQYALQVANLTEGVKAAEDAQAEAKVAADRAVAWLKAVRDAPGEVAKRLEWCGKIGHGVHIELDAAKITNGAAVKITVDGRSWKEPLTSKGRQVQVDFLIRDALARALGFVNKAGVRTLPIVVDNRHLWSGELPGEGPVIELVTDQPEWVADNDGETRLEYPTGPLRSVIE